ncbi:hypothetical protein DFQ27_009768, partial [Actinomortierella ambigua]
DRDDNDRDDDDRYDNDRDDNDRDDGNDSDNDSFYRRASKPDKTKKPKTPKKPKMPKKPKTPKTPKTPKKPTKPKTPKKPTKPKMPTKPTTPTTPKAGFEQQILDAHNQYRAIHKAPPLVWDPKAATHGNNWIQACQFKHSQNRQFGENLAYGYKDFPTAIKAWYDEERLYNYNNPSFSMATGHFTQVVWKSTKAVGCAVKYCDGYRSMYICNYSPPGNMMGRFGDNVEPPRRKA